MRLLDMSATYTVPEVPSTAKEPGQRNAPGRSATWCRVELKTRTRLLYLSATYTVPDEPSTATPRGLLNGPGRSATWCLVELNTKTRLPYPSATYTVPDEPSTATPYAVRNGPVMSATWCRVELNTKTRLPYPSATYTVPDEPSAATPYAERNWPVMSATWCRVELNTRMRLPYPSATYTAPEEPSTATPVGRSSWLLTGPGPPRVAASCGTGRRFCTVPEETSMSDASRVAAFAGSLNSMMNGTACGLAWLDCAGMILRCGEQHGSVLPQSVGPDWAGTIAGTGGVPSRIIANRAAALPFPAASRAAPAGMSTSTVPSAAGATSNVYDAPPPVKLSTLLLEAAPERTMSGAANPVTASPNSTVKLSASALVGLDCAAVIAGTGGVPSYVIKNRAAASL